MFSKISVLFLSSCPHCLRRAVCRRQVQLSRSLSPLSPLSPLLPFSPLFLDSVAITSTYCPRARTNIKDPCLAPEKPGNQRPNFSSFPACSCLFSFSHLSLWLTPFDDGPSPCAVVRLTGLAPFRLLSFSLYPRVFDSTRPIAASVRSFCFRHPFPRVPWIHQ
jgi:hypothetical protein